MTAPADPRVEWLTVAGDPDAWRSIGLVVGADGMVPLIGAGLRIVAPATVGASDRGIVGWAMSGIDHDVDSIDGLATDVVAPVGPRYCEHPLGASGIDHVVVSTPDLERTARAIAAATGCEQKRVREAGTMRQGFHRIGRGGLVVEVVSQSVPAGGQPADQGPAAFWGLALDVADLDAVWRRLGPDLVGEPKEAVQPGRRIATIRAAAGLGVPVALMTPDDRR